MLLKWLCGSLKCGMYKSDNRTITILGVHYSYDKDLETEDNFKSHISNTEGVLKLYTSRT